MANPVNINDMVSSIYGTVQQLNQAISDTIGVDAAWCRAIPYENSEDVIFGEYTLLNVDCPKMIKAVVNNSDYNPGNLKVDLFGTDYEQPLELSIEMQTWKSTFGNDTMPQRGDICFIQLFNKLYEVVSSTPKYTMNKPTTYTAQLKKYNPVASRRESEEMINAIDDMTNNVVGLFGQTITNEIVDANDALQTDSKIQTYVDPVVELDVNGIVQERLAVDSNIVSESYYDFNKTEKNIIASVDNYSFEPNSRWLFSCWFKTENIETTYQEITSIERYSQNVRGVTYLLTIKSKAKKDMIEPGTSVEINRGDLIKVAGTITRVSGNRYVFEVPTKEVNRANKKLTDWNTFSGWTIGTKQTLNILTGYDMGEVKLSIDYTAGCINFNVGNSKECQLELPKDYDSTQWHYIALEFSVDETKLYIREHTQQHLDHYSSDCCTSVMKHKKKDFSIDKFEVLGNGSDLKICNIRVYDLAYPIDDDNIFKMDSQSRFSYNGSNLLLSIQPNIHNKVSYVSKLT